MTNSRTAPIKFTATTVREVTGRVSAFTDGAFSMSDVAEDQGKGVRYTDAHAARTWYGPMGARQACAYYIGGALGTAAAGGKPIPDDDTAFLKAVQAAYLTGAQSHKDGMKRWEELGQERARLLAEARS